MISKEEYTKEEFYKNRVLKDFCYETYKRNRNMITSD